GIVPGVGSGHVAAVGENAVSGSVNTWIVQVRVAGPVEAAVSARAGAAGIAVAAEIPDAALRQAGGRRQDPCRQQQAGNDSSRHGLVPPRPGSAAGHHGADRLSGARERTPGWCRISAHGRFDQPTVPEDRHSGKRPGSGDQESLTPLAPTQSQTSIFYPARPLMSLPFSSTFPRVVSVYLS